jgi:hypothetical protein
MTWWKRLCKAVSKWFRGGYDEPKPDPVEPSEPVEPTPQPTPDPVPVPTPVSREVGITGNRFAASGKKFTPVIDTAWRLALQVKAGKVSVADLDWYLSMRRAQGFNVIQFGDDGEAFTSTGAMIPAVIAAIRTVLDACDRAGMYALVGTGLHRYDGNGKAFRYVADGAEDSAGYSLAYALWRPGVMGFYINGLDDKQAVAPLLAMASGVRRAAPNILISWHPAHGAASYPAVGPGPLCSWIAVHSGHRELSAGHASGLVKACVGAGVPVIDIEPCYEGMPQYGNAEHIINADDVARAVGAAVKAGAAGVGYGHHVVWGFSNGWKSAVEKAAGAKRAAMLAQGV